jgi:hypothetical protein
VYSPSPDTVFFTIVGLGLILLIPCADSEGSQRIYLPLDTSYEDALETIHDTIGCSAITKKPTLAYRLSTSTVRSDPINLCRRDDWEGCLDDVMAAQNKKTKAAAKLTVTVKIIVPDIVSTGVLL